MFIWHNFYPGYRSILIFLLFISFSAVLLQPSTAIAQETQQLSTSSTQKLLNKKLSFKERLMSLKQKLLDDSQSKSAVYSCPMHPEVIRDKPGKCKKCGMFLVKLTDQVPESPPMQIQMVTKPMNRPSALISSNMPIGISKHNHDHSAGMQESDEMLMMYEIMDAKSNSTFRFWDSETSLADPLPSKQHEHEHRTGLTPEKPLPSIFKPVKHAMPGLSPNQSDQITNGKYVCPMHPQIIQDGPDKCPICGMNLVAHKNHAPDTENP
jgi:hypothetical protein